MAYDLSDPDFLINPQPQLARMRSEGALVQIKIPLIGKTWVTTTDAAARQVLKNSDLFVRNAVKSGGTSIQKKFWFLPNFLKPLLANMTSLDGDDHKRIRSLVDQAFARSEIEELRPQLWDISNGLLDQIPAGQEIDLIETYCRPLPLAAICALLGIEDRDRERVTKMISPISSTNGALTLLLALPGLRKLIKHFHEDVAHTRLNPRPGLINEMIIASDKGHQLSDDELVAMIMTLFAAGHETTVHLIATGLRTLLGNPDLMRFAKDNPDKLPIMVEEFMRFGSPVIFTNPMFVAQDTEFEGIKLKKNDQITACLIGANYDEQRHSAPTDFQAERRPNAHLGFGHGPHVCLGIQLARAEAQIAIEAILKRFPKMQLAAPDLPPDYRKRPGLRGLKSLKVILDL